MSEDGIKILLVGESPSDVRLLQEALPSYTPQRFGIVQAGRLDEALALVARQRFDVILLNPSLPDSRGLDTCRRMIAAVPQTPTLVLTEAANEHLAAAAMRLGVQYYLVKGQTPGVVIGRAVGYAIERGRARRALQEANGQLQQQAEELQVQMEELTTANEELRSSEQALRESEERFRAAYEQAAIGIEMVDFEGHLLRGNGWLSRMLGYTEQELQGHTFAELTHPGDLDRERPLLKRLLAGEIPNYSLEKRYLHKDGHPVWVRVTSSLVHTSTPYRISIIEDITQRRRNEEALRELNATLELKVAERTAQLEQRARQLQKLALELSETENRERKHLAEILHDDLQQVLAAAKFHLGMLNHQLRGEPQAKIIQIDHMLSDAIAKSRSLSHELSPTVLHHNDLAETFAWLAGQMQLKHGLAVTVQAPEALPLQSEALGMLLYKTAQELLFNVVKHARVKEARLRVRRCGPYIALSVRDQGRGFDLQEVRQTAGFGLLSIRERIELLGGHIKVKSAQGRGATFYLVVPDTPGSEDGGRKTEDRTKAWGELPSTVVRPLSSASTLRVLVADDHEIVREGLALLLTEEQAIEVVGEAANGREAVDLADRLHPDVVIMDVSMPLMSGDEATRQIKRHLPRTRIVALSMFEEPEMVQRMRQAGADHYVLKTAPSEELLAAVRGG